jgi:hypothetical protein
MSSNASVDARALRGPETALREAARRPAVRGDVAARKTAGLSAEQAVIFDV